MKYLLYILLMFVTGTALSQNNELVMIPLPENIRSQDLNFLKNELHGRKIVMLGEMSHNDGNVFETKAALVKYLVEEMGFTTIAFESGVFDVWQAQKGIDRGGDVREELQGSLFPVWSHTNEFQSFIDFFTDNKGRLKLYGFDLQITGSQGFEKLVGALYPYCKANGLRLNLKSDDLALLLESISKSGLYDDADIPYPDFRSALNLLVQQLDKQKPTDDSFYWKQVVRSLLVLGEDSVDRQEIYSSFNTTASDNLRDRKMAENLLEYIRKHPGEKIICWGANQHFVNDISSVHQPVLKDFKPMGTYLKAELKDELYSLASVTANDSVFLQNRWHQTTVDPNSFERFLKNQGAAHLFVSSSQQAMAKPRLNRLFSPVTFIDARLDQLHDGYLFFLSTTPSTFMEVPGHTLKGPIGVNDLSSNIETYTPDESELLNAVVIYSKKTPYQIIKSALEKRDVNYPDHGFGSTLFTNIEAVIDGNRVLDVDFIAEQYDKGYNSHTDRSTKKLKDVRWNVRSLYEPKSLQEFHGLMYNSPIQYAPLLHPRKFRKFDLTLQEVKRINGEEVYVIGFESPRNHSTFTRRVYLSRYSGTVYINKKDLAIVKLYEQWDVTDFPEAFQQGYELTDDLAKYIKKEYFSESTVSDFKQQDGHYYLSHAANTVSGIISAPGQNSLPYQITTDSYWYGFDLGAPKIPFKNEQLFLHKVAGNLPFWQNFKLPE